MTPRSFVAALSEIEMEGVFNPYRNRCEVHDLADAPAVRRRNLRNYLSAIEELGVDTIWMGRDLGYRGGRRTGLALTDEQRLDDVALTYPGAAANKATRGPVVAERTAAEIWAILARLERCPLLWNVFPFHPHEADDALTNRKFTARELASVSELNDALFKWLNIRRIICIGQDAATYSKAFGVSVECVRHPSYGGVTDFRRGMREIYGASLLPSISAAQSTLF
ncbi:uracil-DNA glycosylase [Alcaligenes faecalis]|uniref:uracil-DNA glycosylase n=1 Tax=Alcaligenes faecalis TaxID=511 RepID=UPI000A2E5ACB|nr:uracil-DNA glycosylase [Alcaligenes faecalis]OSZ35163.1 uracil-DNA glycosylase [Alcaligenes faecalis]OSZ38877.1 uracil-DNA glycosylase [Alcaligenes faecalis]